MPQDPHDDGGPSASHGTALKKVRRKARLVEARLLSPTVRELTLEVDADPAAPFSYQAGQYVELLVPTKSLTMKRPYSIASAPGERGENRFDIAVTRAESGLTSHALHGHDVGDDYEIEGPRGHFTRRHADQPTLFVGVGTGLAPLRAMIQDALRAPSGPPLALLFGGRDEAHLLWRDDLESWKLSQRVRVDVTLSRAAQTWTGLRGYVQDHATAAYDRVHPAQVYVCGITSMVADIVAALEKHGVDARSIYSEAYS